MSKMLRKKKKEKESIVLTRPSSPTSEEIIEDVQNAAVDDYVFIFMQDGDESEESDSSASEEEFYDVRETFDTDTTFLYETVEERYETMCKFLRMRERMMERKTEVEGEFSKLEMSRDELARQLDQLKLEMRKQLQPNLVIHDA